MVQSEWIYYYYHYCCLNKAQTSQSDDQSQFYSSANSSLSLQSNLCLLCDTLVLSRTALTSPEVILILLMCPLFQEGACLLGQVMGIALVISDLKEDSLTALSKHASFFSTHKSNTDSLESKHTNDDNPIRKLGVNLSVVCRIKLKCSL